MLSFGSSYFIHIALKSDDIYIASIGDGIDSYEAESDLKKGCFGSIYYGCPLSIYPYFLNF
jgi:hypothetical protein